MPSAVARVVALVTVLLASSLGAGTSRQAEAHDPDARVVPVLDRVTPALPEGVVLQVVASVVPQFVARNPTSTVLEVLGESDRPFLRISRAGVLADLGAPDWAASNSPAGAQGAGGAPRWVLVDRGDSWGWFDHRLHPGGLRVSGAQPRTLGRWEVPLRYGGATHVATGRIEQRPVLGSFVVEVDRTPAGVSATPLQGRLPGLFVATSGPEVTVLGTDGRPFLHFRRGRVLVDPASPSWRADQQARGRLDAASRPGLVQLSTSPTHAWLDPRLRYDGLLPPEQVLAAAEPAVVRRWEIPLVVAGRPDRLTGVVRWIPADERVAPAPAAAEPDSPSAVLWVGGGLVTAAVVLVVATFLRRRREDSQAAASNG